MAGASLTDLKAPAADLPKVPLPESPKKAAHTIGSEIVYALRFARGHIGALLLVFFGLVLPLWGFAALYVDVHRHHVFAFDLPLLSMLHALETPTLDSFFVLISKLGFVWGVLPLDVIVLLWLALRRRYRDTLFFGLAVIGSEILNFAVKNYVTRARPTLWLSITPEATYSFPSGHAMASATLGVALILLFWPTRWRWLVATIALVLVLLIGISRVYLGVHYPSDILAAWAAGIAWTVAMHQLVDRTAPPPPVAVSGTDAVGKGPGTAKPAEPAPSPAK